MNKNLITTTLLASLPLVAVAEQQANSLDPIVVTASRNPTEITNTVAQVRVIKQQDLSLYQGQTALDVIKIQPGVSSYGSGGADKATNIFLRGYSGSQILVLIDGIRYSSATTGTAALNLLPADQIERIEILYGATGAALYGADAMGGVIQVFSKKTVKQGTHGYVTLGGGSHGHFTYGAGAGYQDDKSSISFNGSHNKNDGFNAIASPYVDSQRDKDGYDSKNGSLAISHKLNDNFTLGGSAIYNRSTSEYDNAFSTASDVITKQRNGSGQIFGDWQYAEGSNLRMQYGESIDKSSNYEDGVNTGTFNTKQQQASLQINQQLPVGEFIAGTEYLKQRVQSDTAFTKTKRDVTSGFVGYQLVQDKFDAQAFVRYDDNSQFGGKTTYNLGAAYALSENLRAGASYATAYRAPTFNELYFPMAWGSGGNPELNPETSKNSEIFVEYADNYQVTRLTGYYNNVKDLITGWTPYNLSKAKIKGVTLTSDWAINDYLFGFSYDYQQAKDASDGTNHGKLLTIRPKHKGTAYVGYRVENIDLRAEYQYVGKYYRTAGETNPISSYGLVNLSGTYRFTPNISVTARINNLFDKDYVTNSATAWGSTTTYNEDGTNVFVGVTLGF
ncbi:TonB-dependent receptor [Testudinibacter sp. TR-2022]|uniref:TonB-dependent receptor domain-containing protein n=1 Tax=Testudinibacter sp. TR-2022 TaxID=2585029 RepID=UPI001117C43D|nr:TonB-dependent receptor [Testudinibacter sp. TR-2022]TNH05580.1 TonB-dependent receptor [Pasteurellaceae bacterium Phil31]TNH08107.1 TonB-dependent receptor [Testudinibacter sp. TR-2022]TNH09519.1 TonB-dependent receptor [Testudinibacter sp. TR-2022]TNH11019.1 TonB-dependent receptor [Testudinibacter sp. TR-2022]TNH15380.1 TonB-dependent receptor [Testudinibacter sp. TR-2022]